MTTPSTNKTVKQVICRKCKSNQIVSNKRGYSFKKMFLTFIVLLIVGLGSLALLILSLSSYNIPAFIGAPSILVLLALPISLIFGFFGRSNLVNGCMNCGHKWQPK